MSHADIYALNATVKLAEGQSPEGLSSGECECEHFIVIYPLKCLIQLILHRLQCQGKNQGVIDVSSIHSLEVRYLKQLAQEHHVLN